MPLKEMVIAMDLNVNDIPERDDYTFWYFGFHDKLDIEMFREDIKSNTGTFKKHPVHFQKKVLLRETPTTYSIWPYCKEKGWLTRLIYKFDPKFAQ
jgi:hypothetical protein